MSYIETLHREHKERRSRILRASATPKIKVRPISHEIPNTPFGIPKIHAPLPKRPAVLRQGIFYIPTKADEAAWTFEICGAEVSDAWPAKSNRPTIDQIQQEVCEHYGISRVDLISNRRTQIFVLPRHVSFYLCRQLTLRSLPDIGRRTGDRDHATVLHGVRRIALWMPGNARLTASIEMLTDRLRGDPE